MEPSDKDRQNRTRAAAVAAVTAYLQAEQAAAAQAAAAESAAPPPSPPPLWGISGRQEIMQTRAMMLLKAFHGGRR